MSSIYELFIENVNRFTEDKLLNNSIEKLIPFIGMALKELGK